MELRLWRSLVLLAALALLVAACADDEPEEAADEEPAVEDVDEDVEEDVGEDVEEPADEDDEAADPAGDMTIGFVVKALDQEFWFAVEDGANDAAEDEGVELFLEGPVAETAIEEQIAIVEDMLSRGVDALAVAPTAPDQLTPVLQRAMDEGTPVLLVDTDIPDWEDKLTFIGTDNVTAGEIAGEYVLEQLGDDGTVAILGGIPGATSGEHRVEGFKNVVEGELDIVAELPADWDRAEAVSVTEDILTSDPDVEAIFAANDQMALGAVQAVRAAGRDLDDVLIVGFDGTPEAAQAVLDGEMDASVAQLPYEMGYQGVVEGIRAAEGEDIEEVIDTGAELVDESNAEEYTE